MAINTIQLSLLLISTFLLSSKLAFAQTQATKANKKSTANINVVVEAMVYCQSCDLMGSWKVSHNNAISNASVSIFCRGNANGGVNYYETFKTNEKGYLYAELKEFKISKDKMDVPINSCYVRVVSSPNKFCNYPTNVNYGFSGLGSPLQRENKMIEGGKHNYRAAVYSAGPLAFRPVYCL